MEADESVTKLGISLYGYLFNSTLRSFDLDGMVSNFTSFADEVVISTLTIQEDDTLPRLLHYQEALGTARFKVVPVDMDITKDNRFDGALKTAAMRSCSVANLLCIADADERFIAAQRPLWDAWAERLEDTGFLDGLSIPVIDLYGRDQTIRADRPIGLKMRLHKHSVVRRGVPSFAERPDGFFDTSRSDSTEPILSDGRVAQFASIVTNPQLLRPQTCAGLCEYPYVIHLGYLDLARRARLGKEFWREHWERRSGHPEDVATEVSQLIGVPVIEHHLPLS